MSTGKELLFQELRERGLKEQQINSKTVAVVLDVIANDGTERYLIAKEVDDELKKKNEALVSLQSRVKIQKWHAEKELEELRSQSEELEKNIKIMKEEFDEYVDEFGKAVSSLETPEARDRLKTAQLFVNSVLVRSNENNTVFIHGLSLILAGLELRDGMGLGFKNMTRQNLDPDRFRFPDDSVTI